MGNGRPVPGVVNATCLRIAAANAFYEDFFPLSSKGKTDVMV